MRLAIPINRPREEEDLRVSSHFGKAYAFAIVDGEEIKVVENPRTALRLERGAGKFIAELFEREGVGAVLLKEVGRGAFNHLRDRGVKVYLLPEGVKKVDEALRLFKEGKLTLLTEPNEL